METELVQKVRAEELKMVPVDRRDACTMSRYKGSENNNVYSAFRELCLYGFTRKGV